MVSQVFKFEQITLTFAESFGFTNLQVWANQFPFWFLINFLSWSPICILVCGQFWTYQQWWVTIMCVCLNLLMRLKKVQHTNLTFYVFALKSIIAMSLSYVENRTCTSCD
jgi:hypothetical protein